MRRLVIAGVTSGVGKTTVATGIMAALARRGLKVQPFKAGPDYIDPSYHTRAVGAPSRNLDTWMIPRPALLELFHRGSAGANIAVVEGVMGLFDGHGGEDESGSTAELAKLLKAPVLLVVDVAKTARSAAAVVKGCQLFDPDLNLAGVILNNVASESHLRWAAQAIEAATGLPVLGHLPSLPSLSLPERHLGLIPMAEGQILDSFFEGLAHQVETTFDLEGILRVAGSAPELTSPPSGLFPEEPRARQISIAVAMDQAFSFYYQDNLDLLAAWGAEIIPFSPLRDTQLPEGVAGVYIGGGFPELYAAELAENQALHQELRKVAEAGMPLYAECGGLMYLCQGMTNQNGRAYAMVGLVPARSHMQSRRAHLRYVTVRARKGSPLLPPGAEIRGHEFHWSTLAQPLAAETAAYEVLNQEGRPEGYLEGNLLASYIHLHFGSDAQLAPNFVAACARFAGLTLS